MLAEADPDIVATTLIRTPAAPRITEQSQRLVIPPPVVWLAIRPDQYLKV
jgi:hypothetical protein